MGHIELARWADIILIAPASANLLARLSHGLADDLLTTLVLASDAPVLLAPAMNRLMWSNAATQDNTKTLLSRGVTLLGPDEGEQACGETGAGRMLEPEDIRDRVVQFAGKMGFALADAAIKQQATVTLIAGPVTLDTPAGVNRIDVDTAKAMHDAVHKAIHNADVFISVAAVADYRVEKISQEKIKKSDDDLTLTLTRNPDILASIAALPNKPFCVGFAAETQHVEKYARGKLEKKKLDMIAPSATKKQIAAQLLDLVALRITER